MRDVIACVSVSCVMRGKHITLCEVPLKKLQGRQLQFGRSVKNESLSSLSNRQLFPWTLKMSEDGVRQA